jgi:hypothetical protein
MDVEVKAGILALKLARTLNDERRRQIRLLCAGGGIEADELAPAKAAISIEMASTHGPPISTQPEQWPMFIRGISAHGSRELVRNDQVQSISGRAGDGALEICLTEGRSGIDAVPSRRFRNS